MYTILDHLSTLPKQSVQLQFDYIRRCIKPELMIFHLNGSQGYLSKEVALTTPTKIKYLGPVRIFYKPAMPQRSKERFIRYEMIESSQGWTNKKKYP